MSVCSCVVRCCSIEAWDAPQTHQKAGGALDQLTETEPLLVD